MNLDRDLRADPAPDASDQDDTILTGFLAAVRADLAALHVPLLPPALAAWITEAGWRGPDHGS